MLLKIKRYVRRYKNLVTLSLCLASFGMFCLFIKNSPANSNVSTREEKYIDPNEFIAIGTSKVYPKEWKTVHPKTDQYFGLTLYGDANSPGQNGASVKHMGDEIETAKRRKKENNFDTVACEKIPLDRAVKDLRHGDCNAVQYDKELPSVSVIVIFYNEAPCALLRTIVSVLIRSPLEFVKEIIVVDDNSNLETNIELIPKFIREYFPPIVKLHRNPTRLGLIKARMAGSDRAVGDVILFLDSHCEVGDGWLEPLLQRIKDDYRNVVMPSHDIIHEDGFEFYGSISIHNQGVFNWGLLHTWQGLPDFDQKAIKTAADPVRSPTMAGGLFAISRRWWEHLGKYDPGFEVWGGENVEISFKTWMCGGRLDIIPCSHVGHVFRAGSPHKGHVKNSMAINQKRLASVWLDEYKEIVYARHPELVELDAGDVSERIALRERLQCHNFDWYMKNVVPDKYIPDLNYVANGGLIASNTECMDTLQHESGSISLYPSCHFRGSQLFGMTESGEFKQGVDICVTASVQDHKAELSQCDGRASQKWTHKTPSESDKGQQIKPKSNSNLCLSFAEKPSGGHFKQIVLETCDSGDEKQLWKFKKYI